MIFEPLFAHAKDRPQDIAIIDDRGQYTYQQVAAMAAALGMYLPTITDKPRIGLLLPAGLGFVASFYGTLLAGKCAMPINFLLGEREIAHVIKDSDVDTILTIPQLAGRLENSGLNVVDLTQLPKPGPDSPFIGITPDFPDVKTDDMAVLMYTSGTSGLPKGVVLTFGNLQSDVDAAIQHARLEHGHKFLGVIPLFHAFGLTAMMLAPIQLGATTIYMARFSAVAALQAIQEHKVSLMFGVPSMFAALAHLKSATPDSFKSIYALISGGEPLPNTLRENFKQRFNTDIYEGYGLTETSPVVTLNVPRSHRAGSVGQRVPGAEVRIVDDGGNEVPIGETGEIWLRGPMVMKGYFNLPDETAKAITRDGFFRTGDLGKFDADGFLYVTGRIKELIIVAGEKATPREIEDVLLKHPAVAEAAVLGKKDESRGEVVVAFVVAKEGQQIDPKQLRDFSRDQGLMQWKIPREVFVVEDLPRSPTGKVLKRVLAEKLAAK